MKKLNVGNPFPRQVSLGETGSFFQGKFGRNFSWQILNNATCSCVQLSRYNFPEIKAGIKIGRKTELVKEELLVFSCTHEQINLVNKKILVHTRARKT